MQTDTVWIPNKGNWSSSAQRVDTAVREYDERLYFRRNPDTNDWCVYIKTELDAGIPVLGFGDTIPHPDDALKKLYLTDTMRHGEKLLDDMNRRNESIRKEKLRGAEEASGEAAEVLEWGHRKMETHPVPRIFVP